jgi:hypothetical protein
MHRNDPQVTRDWKNHRNIRTRLASGCQGLNANRRWFMKNALECAGAAGTGARLLADDYNNDSNNGKLSKGVAALLPANRKAHLWGVFRSVHLGVQATHRSMPTMNNLVMKDTVDVFTGPMRIAYGFWCRRKIFPKADLNRAERSCF